MSNLISRQQAIDTEGLDVQIRCEMCRNPMHTDRGCDGHCKYDEKLYERIIQILDKRITPLPSAQPDAPDTNVGDIISRQAAVTEIAKFMLEYGGENEKRERDALHRAANGIKALPSVQPERQWIPCSERLPEDYTNVLVWFEYFRYGDYNCLYQTYGIGDYSTKYDSWMINHETGWHKLRVIAWMPLPESYKERPEE